MHGCLPKSSWCSQLSAAEGEGEKKMWNSATIVRQILNLYFYLVVLIK
jgi:hypothetical protein